MARGSYSSPDRDNGSPQTTAVDQASDIFPLSTPTHSTLTSPTITPSEYQPPTYAELLAELDRERTRRYQAEGELAMAKSKLLSKEESLQQTKETLEITKMSLKQTEEALEELRKKHWTAHMIQAAEEMGPGGALIATVGAPVMAAPLAVATVVKGFQSVGSGIGSLFSKGKGKDTKDPKNPDAGGGGPEGSKGPTSPVVESFSFYSEAQKDQQQPGNK